MRRQMLLVPARPEPFEAYLLSAAVLSGVLQLLAGASGNAVSQLLPYWMRVAWYVLLTVGGVVALAGMFWPNPVRGLEIERHGMVLLAPAAAVYAVAVGYIGGWRGVMPVVMTLGFSLACLARAWYVTRNLRGVTRSDLTP